MTCATSVPILVFLGLSVLELGPLYAIDRQTHVRRQTDVKSIAAGRCIINAFPTHTRYHKILTIYAAPNSVFLVLSIITGRIAAKRQTAGIKIYSEAENQHFRPTGGTPCTDSCEIWHSRGALGSAWWCEISRQSVHGRVNATQKVENFYFLVKSHPAGRTL